MKFVRFREYNDHEGETWNHWLQVDGNEDELRRLAGHLSDTYAEDGDPWFELFRDDELTEPEVDLLVRYGEDGYMPQHAKVTGRMLIPARMFTSDVESTEEMLYKGSISGFFVPAETQQEGQQK